MKKLIISVVLCFFVLCFFKVVDAGHIKLVNKKVSKSGITLSRTFSVYLDENIAEPKYYRNLCELLHHVRKNDTVIFRINTGGGRLDTTILIYNSIKRTKAKTIAEIYKAYSAGAIIAMACDKIRVLQFGSFMVHTGVTGYRGKMSEIKDFAIYGDKLMESILRDAFTGFLAEWEIKQILKGREIWILEKELKKRLKKMKKLES